MFALITWMYSAMTLHLLYVARSICINKFCTWFYLFHRKNPNIVSSLVLDLCYKIYIIIYIRPNLFHVSVYQIWSSVEGKKIQKKSFFYLKYNIWVCTYRKVASISGTHCFKIMTQLANIKCQNVKVDSCDELIVTRKHFFLSFLQIYIYFFTEWGSTGKQNKSFGLKLGQKIRKYRDKRSVN